MGDGDKYIKEYEAKLIPYTINLLPTDIAILDKLAKFSQLCAGDNLVLYMVQSIVDGARRPGSWERGMMQSLGIECNNDVYQQNSVDLLVHWKTLETEASNDE